MVGLRYGLVSVFKYVDMPVAYVLLYFVLLLAEAVVWYGRVGLVVGDSVFLLRVDCDLVVGVGGVVAWFCSSKDFLLCLKGGSVWWVMFEELVVDS